jgi:hypothetical protein
MPTLISRSTFLSRTCAALVALLAGSAKADGAAKEKRPPAATRKRYTMVVLTNAKEGKDEEFNHWYTNRHLHDVLATPGFVRAQRFRLVVNPSTGGPSWRYYASYELETDDPKAAVDELMRRSGTDKMPVSDSMDSSNFFFSVYEAITPVAHE